MAISEALRVMLTMEASQYKREAREASTATGKIATGANQVTTATGRMQQGMSRVGTAAKVFLAGTALVAVTKFAKDSIGAASDLNESINAVNVTFGESAKGVLAIGENAAESFGMASSEFNSFAVRFSAFAKTIAQQEGRDVVDVVKEMTTRIADFASVHNLSLERAAEVAQSTMAGQTEVFRQFGGDVSDAAVQAKGLELGLKGVGDELTEQEKQLIRYQLFMEQTADTAGDWANTSDEFAGSQKKLTAQIKDAQAVIGQQLLPVLADLFTKVSNNIDTILDLSDAFFVVVGLAGEAEVAIRKMKRELGEDAANSAVGLLTAFDAVLENANTMSLGFLTAKWRAGQLEEGLGDLREHLGSMSRDELEKARDGLEKMAAQEGWTRAETELLAAALKDALAPATYEAVEGINDIRSRIESGLNPALRSIPPVIPPIIEVLERLETASDQVWKAAVEDVASFLTGFKELPDEAELTLDEFLTNYQERLSKIGEFSRNLEILVRAGLTDIAAVMAEEGPEVAGQVVQDLVDGIGSGVASSANDLIAHGRAITALIASGFQDIPIIFRPSPPRLAGGAVTSTVRVSSGSGGVQERQGGGRVEAGGLYEIGEAGREGFRPDVPGHIVPHHQLVSQSRLGGGDVTVHVHGTVIAEKDLAESIREELFKNQRRNGSTGLM